MNGAETWGEAITISLLNMSEKFLNFFPTFFGAVLVFLAGWVVAVTMGKLVEKAIRSMRVDHALEKLGLRKRMGRISNGFTVAEFFGGLLKWFLILVFLMAATDILKLNQVTSFLNSVILYLPNVMVSVVILSVVFLLGNFVYDVVKGSTAAAGVMSATLLAAISKWSIMVFGFFAALVQLGVASTLVNTIFIGIVAMISLAGGLAFGLGGRDEAAFILKRIREEITENKR
jgi:hypothetical protein